MKEVDKNKIPKIICIYLLICQINDKIYIGQTKCLNIRMNRHKNDNERIIDKAIQKYGWDNFKLFIIYEWDFLLKDKYEIIALETAYIEEYQSLIKYKRGYNVCLFSNDMTGFKHSKMTKLKMSLIRKGKYKGKNHPMYGKKNPCTERRKELLSKSFSGKCNPAFDKTIYKFINKNTNEKFIGYRFDLVKKYNLNNSGNLSLMIKGERKSCDGWMLLR